MANESALLEEPEVEVEELSLRETIEKAVDDNAPEEKAPLEPAQKDLPGIPPRDEGKRPADQPKPESAKPAVAPETPAAPVTPVELKAPAQWKPAVREKWNTLPREVKEEVLRREADSMRLIGSVGPKIRMADELNQHMQPFAEKLEQSGVSHQAFLGDIFTTIKSLSTGDPVMKAEVVANIVQSYGVDLRALDAVLSRRIQQPPEVMEARRQMLQAQSIIQQQKSGNEQQQVQAADSAISAFQSDPKHEFLDDVRDLMADLIESGRVKTLEDAYAAAVWANPDTRKILLQREAEARVVAKSNRAGAARKASMAVGGAPRLSGMAPAGQSSMSLRETIAAAIDAQDS